MTGYTHRTRPVGIVAHQWFENGDHPDDNIGEELTDQATGEMYQRQEGEVVRFFRRLDVAADKVCRRCRNHTMKHHGWVDTLEGGHIVCPGDWIITGLEGEMYPCKPVIFDKKYRAVDE